MQSQQLVQCAISLMQANRCILLLAKLNLLPLFLHHISAPVLLKLLPQPHARFAHRRFRGIVQTTILPDLPNIIPELRWGFVPTRLGVQLLHDSAEVHGLCHKVFVVFEVVCVDRLREDVAVCPLCQAFADGAAGDPNLLLLLVPL